MFQQLITNKKYLLIVVVSAILLLVMFFTVLILRSTQENNLGSSNITPTLFPSATPTPVPQELLEEYNFGQVADDSFLENALEAEQIEESEVEQTSRTGDLLDILPYSGENFSFRYDYTALTFVLTLQREFIDEGTTEFEQFLLQNDIATPEELGSYETEFE